VKTSFIAKSAVASFVRSAAGTSRRRRWPVHVGPPAIPDCPAGWDVGPPGFVGVGSHRCGTTWWFDVIASHPLVDVVPGQPKELHFFDRFCWTAFEDDAVAAYHQYFPRRRGHIAGEWTPRYMHDAWTPPLLRRSAPEARVIALVRDPIDRYVSGLAFDRVRGAPEHATVASEAFNRGLYGRQLRNLLKHFDRGRVLVLQYERCITEPRAELLETLRFLELEEWSPQDELLARRTNATKVAKPQFTDSQLTDLVESYEEDVTDLVRMFPSIDVRLWPHFAHLSSASSTIDRIGVSP
jgi:sulfotransferase family protein